MKSLVKTALIATLALCFASGAFAQATGAAVTASRSVSSGEVKKVDRSAGKMTIKHGPLTNLGMDAITMVFRVKDASMLDQVKTGDKINFVAEEPNGQLTVTKLEKQN